MKHSPRTLKIPGLSILAAGLALGAAACPAAPVAPPCPPDRESCGAKRPVDRPRPAPPRGPETPLFGLAAPRSFGVPHTLERPRSVALDPAGELLAIADLWGTITVVGVKDGKYRHRFFSLEELEDGLRLAFTRDGRYLVSAGHAHTRLKLWNMETGRLEREQKVDGYPIRDLSTGPGQEVAVATSRGAEIWDLKSGQRRHLFTMPYDLPVTRVAGSRQGLWAVGDRAGNVRLVRPDSAGGGSVVPTPGSRLVALTLSADSSLMASGFQDGLVRLTDTATGTLRKGFRFFARGAIASLGVTGNGTQVAVAEESGKLSCLDARDARTLASLQATPQGAQALDVSLTDLGTRLALVDSSRHVIVLQGRTDARPVQLPASYEPSPLPRPSATIRLLQPARILVETPGLEISSFALGRRGQFLALGGKPSKVVVYYLDYRPPGGAPPAAKRIYERASAKAEGKQAAEPVWTAISPDRKWLMAEGGGFSLNRWSLLSGRKIRSKNKVTPGLRGLLPMEDGKAVISLAGREVFGRAPTGQKRFRFPGLDEAYWMGTATRPDRLVMIRGWDRMAGFDLPSGVLLWSHDSGPLSDYEVMAVAIPPKSRTLITYHANGFVRRYNVDSGALLDRSRIPAPAGVQRCALRPDGRVLACGHAKGIDLMEVPGGAPLGSLPAPLADAEDALRVRDLVYSPQGNVLAAQIGRSQVAVYSFDHAEQTAPYEGVEAKARIRLGLPIAPPPLRDQPSALYKPVDLPAQGPLRRDQGKHSPDPSGVPRTPGPPPSSRP